MKIVYLKVNLERVLTIGPSTFVSFNDAAVGAESVSTVTMENPSDMPITVKNLTVDGDIKVDLADGSIVAPHSKKEVKISLTPSKPGQIYGSLKFTASGNGADEEFLLPAYGTVTKVANK